MLAASLFSKAMGITDWFVPDSVKAAANRLIVARNRKLLKGHLNGGTGGSR